MNTSENKIKNTHSPDHMAAALARFLQAYPAFGSTQTLDDLRARDYARLDEQGHIYLDYTGGGLYDSPHPGRRP